MCVYMCMGVCVCVRVRACCSHLFVWGWGGEEKLKGEVGISEILPDYLKQQKKLSVITFI